MATSYHLSVLTPEKSVLEQEVSYLQAPGMSGYFGVLANHAPIIAALDSGKFTVRGDDGKDVVYCLSGGFFEFSDNKAVVLADSMEGIAEIDVERARRAADRAKERLDHRNEAEVDAARAEAALKRALNRIRVAKG